MRGAPPAVTAAVVSAERTTLRFGAYERTLDCLYVVVDARARREVADFLAGWQRCCDVVAFDWQAVRRPLSALVGVELRRCCDGEASGIRLVFDVRRDRDALEALMETEALVVGNRRFGAFANTVAVYGVDPVAVRNAIDAAEHGLARPMVVNA